MPTKLIKSTQSIVSILKLLIIHGIFGFNFNEVTNKLLIYNLELRPKHKRSLILK